MATNLATLKAEVRSTLGIHKTSIQVKIIIIIARSFVNKSVTEIVSLTIMSLVTLKAGAKCTRKWP